MNYVRHRTPLVILGLLSDFLGAVVVGFSGYFGLAAGFGGSILWESPHWRNLWWVGWALLALGFLLQLLAAIFPRREENRGLKHSSSIQNIVLLIFIVLAVGFAAITYFQYVRGAVVDLLSQGSIYLGLLGIVFSYWLSLTTITRIDKSLYPDEFEIQVFASRPVKPHRTTISPVRINGRNITFKDIGFRFSVRNTSKRYPATNVFLTIHFEKNKFLADGKEISDDSDNIEISNRIQDFYKSYQCMTIDNLTIETKADQKSKEFIGVGIIIPSIPPHVTIHFFVPMKIELLMNVGMIVIEASKMRCMFNYEFSEDVEKPKQVGSFETGYTGVSLNPGSITDSGATPVIRIKADKTSESENGESH